MKKIVAVCLVLVLANCGQSKKAEDTGPANGAASATKPSGPKEKAPPPPGDPTLFRDLTPDKLEVTVVDAVKFAKMVESPGGFFDYTYRGKTGGSVSDIPLWDAYCLGTGFAIGDDGVADPGEVLVVEKMEPMDLNVVNLTPVSVSIHLKRTLASGSAFYILNCLLNNKNGAEIRAIAVGDVQRALEGIARLKVK